MWGQITPSSSKPSDGFSFQIKANSLTNGWGHLTSSVPSPPPYLSGLISHCSPPYMFYSSHTGLLDSASGLPCSFRGDSMILNPTSMGLLIYAVFSRRPSLTVLLQVASSTTLTVLTLFFALSLYHVSPNDILYALSPSIELNATRNGILVCFVPCCILSDYCKSAWHIEDVQEISVEWMNQWVNEWTSERTHRVVWHSGYIV